MLNNFKNIAYNRIVKAHFLHSSHEYFPDKLGSLIEEQDETFLQGNNEMEE